MSTIESKLKTQADCESAGGTWNTATSTCTLSHSSDLPKSDAELIRENESLRAKVELREKQLQDAIKIANKAITIEKAKEDAERDSLVNRIVLDSNNKFKPEDLNDKTLSELRLIQTVLDKSLDQTFASIAAIQADAQRRKEPLLTAGAWDSKKKEWIGGV